MTTKRQTIGFRYEDGWIQTEAEIQVTGLFRKKYKLFLYDKKIKSTEEYMKIRKAIGENFKMTEKEQAQLARILRAEKFIKGFKKIAKELTEAHKGSK